MKEKYNPISVLSKNIEKELKTIETLYAKEIKALETSYLRESDHNFSIYRGLLNKSLDKLLKYFYELQQAVEKQTLEVSEVVTPFILVRTYFEGRRNVSFSYANGSFISYVKKILNLYKENANPSVSALRYMLCLQTVDLANLIQEIRDIQKIIITRIKKTYGESDGLAAKLDKFVLSEDSLKTCIQVIQAYNRISKERKIK